MAIEKKFRAAIGSEERGTSFIELPFDVAKVFGRARPPVVVTIRGHAWRSTVAVYGGRSYVPVRRSNREGAGVAIGDRVAVTVALDEAPRTVEPPPALAQALAKDAKARAGWEKLSFSHQREHAEAIAGAKKEETRARRVEKALEMLRGR